MLATHPNLDTDMQSHKFGVSATLLTPFQEDFSIDIPRLTELALSVLDSGCNNITIFGTTGEGPSLSESEKNHTHRALLAAGVSPEQIVVAIGSTAVATAIAQAQSALDLGCRFLLVIPPFYFKNIQEQGLLNWYHQFFNGIGSADPRVILYHIPQLTHVQLTPQLVCDLQNSFGSLVYGIKDSSGHWPTIKSLLAIPNLEVITGDERCLAQAITLGGAGTISGMTNLIANEIASIWCSGIEDAKVMRLIDALVQLPVVPALKALLAYSRGDNNWYRVRAPLLPLLPEQIENLVVLYQNLTSH